MKIPTSQEVERIKQKYPVGTVIKLDSMSDPYSPITKGSIGEVIAVDDCGTLHMKWENGRSLGVVQFEDKFTVISTPKIETQELEIGGF